MNLAQALPRLLSRHRSRRRGLRRIAGSALRSIATFLFFISAIPIELGTFLLRAAGRFNGAAFEMEKDR
jgi:hypothetical protein